MSKVVEPPILCKRFSNDVVIRSSHDEEIQRRMSDLRDTFAGMAMAALLEKGTNSGWGGPHIAVSAYSMADHMMKVRNGG